MPPKARYIACDVLERFMVDVFKGLGVPEDEARTCADVLITADKRGIDSHGVGRLKPIYYDRIVRDKIQSPVTRFEIVRDSMATAVVDGHHGMGMVIASRCMQMAINDAGITKDEIDNINSHGTSTQLNDLAETRAIKRVFGERSKKIPVTANKSMLGHLWGAAGAVEAIFSVLTINRGVIPPTINYTTPDPECDLDYTPNVARKAGVKMVLSNSFGFGGTNGSLVFRRFSG